MVDESILTPGKFYNVKFIDHYVDENKSLDDALGDGACYLNCYGMYLGKSKHYHVFARSSTNYDEDLMDYDTFHVIPGTFEEINPLLPKVVFKGGKK